MMQVSHQNLIRLIKIFELFNISPNIVCNVVFIMGHDMGDSYGSDYPSYPRKNTKQDPQTVR